MSVRRQGYDDMYPLGSSGYGGHGGGGGYGGGGTSISIDLCQVNLLFLTCKVYQWQQFFSSAARLSCSGCCSCCGCRSPLPCSPGFICNNIIFSHSLPCDAGLLFSIKFSISFFSVRCRGGGGGRGGVWIKTLWLPISSKVGHSFSFKWGNR